MIGSTLPTLVGYTGYFYEIVKKIFSVGKENPESKEARLKKSLEKERKTIQPIYNSKGKLIEYDNFGRHLDFVA